MTRADTPKLAYSVPEAAKALGLSVRQIRRMVAAGELPLVPHTGRRRLIPCRRLEEWANGR